MELDKLVVTSHDAEFYIGAREKPRYQEAIFHSEEGRLTRWFDRVSVYGLVALQSPYYIAFDESQGEAIFHISGKQVSNWFRSINPTGLVQGQSEFYVAQSWENNREAIFHVDFGQVSPWYDVVYAWDILTQGSQFYIAGFKEGLGKFSYALFYISGKQISDRYPSLQALQEWYDHHSLIREVTW